MEELLNWLEYIDWVEIELFAKEYREYLSKYIELKNGIPSHNRLNRVMGMLSPEVLQQVHGKWQELLNKKKGEALKMLICIDGKTMRSNKNKGGNAPPILFLPGAMRMASVWARKR